jgi:hypothetical protein
MIGHFATTPFVSGFVEGHSGGVLRGGLSTSLEANGEWLARALFMSNGAGCEL